MGNSDVLEPVAPLLSIVDAVLRDILKLWISMMAWEYVFGFQVSLALIKSTSISLRSDAFSQSFCEKNWKREKKTKNKQTTPFPVMSNPFRNFPFIKTPQ